MCDVMQLEIMSSSDETQVGDVDLGGTYIERQKSSKPIMEKRRRARINSSLNELKSILLEALKKDSTRHSKLEKADILEMTVKYLKNVERQRLSVSLSIDPAEINQYKAGFNECRNEVMRFLSTCEGVTVDVRTRLLNHLATCLHSIQKQQSNIFDESVADFGLSQHSNQPASILSNGQAIQVQFSDSTVPVALGSLNTGFSPIIAPKPSVLKRVISGREQPLAIVRTLPNYVATPVVLQDSIQLTSQIGGISSANIAFLLPPSLENANTSSMNNAKNEVSDTLTTEGQAAEKILSSPTFEPSLGMKVNSKLSDDETVSNKTSTTEFFTPRDKTSTKSSRIYKLNKDNVSSTCSNTMKVVPNQDIETMTGLGLNKRRNKRDKNVKQEGNQVQCVPADSTESKKIRHCHKTHNDDVTEEDFRFTKKMKLKDHCLPTDETRQNNDCISQLENLTQANTANEATINKSCHIHCNSNFTLQNKTQEPTQTMVFCSSGVSKPDFKSMAATKQKGGPWRPWSETDLVGE
uniref:Transcription factor protein n=1 Tax=Ciona intestinalis TaxID=7719 RepID=Q4H3N9_CIOIN|nr:transcription factor protein [Ciona intestinalis]BAE06388.1 transcription factor protein [Ciona intestinalis]|eukprot:NP_001071685.1 transcription factor protein [Ciona intestinalis]